MKKLLFAFAIISALISFSQKVRIISAASPWYDEQCTHFAVNRKVLEIFVGDADPVHTPGYFLILKAFTGIPHNIYTFRIISAVSFLISLKLFYLIGTKIKDEIFGYVLTIAYSYSVYFFNFDWQTRMYSVSLVTILASLLLLEKLGKFAHRRQLIIFSVVNLLGLYIDYAFFWYLMPLLCLSALNLVHQKNTLLCRQIIVSILCSFAGFLLLYPEFFTNVYLGLSGIRWTRENMVPAVFLAKFFGGSAGRFFLLYNISLFLAGIFQIFTSTNPIPRKIILTALVGSLFAYGYSVLYTPLFHVRSLQIVGIAIIFALATFQYHLYRKNPRIYLLSVLPMITGFLIHVTTDPFRVL
ncbi:hypothetical protein A3B57_01370 [Microgenomates group bacterium RIFCSPLOWO2_01_FULL_47_10]|nr:MAG: hypothetical protein A3B57_01370 [Microgenomates group bacterium RIFCSPLOWO2_01_FULL_47_10]